MFSIKSVIGDISERAVSTGWQAAAAYVIAADVFHDPGLAFAVAGGLSVVKSAVVWLYAKNKAAIDKEITDVSGLTPEQLADLGRQIFGDVMADITAQQTTAALAPVPVSIPIAGAIAPGVTIVSGPPPVTSVPAVSPPAEVAPVAPARRVPPFMQHPRA